ncbi:MAG: hypothetical protein AB1597_05350 [Chloroflexota bacterium]
MSGRAVIVALVCPVLVHPQIALPVLSASQESLPVRSLALVVGLVVALAAGIALYVLTRVRKK